MRYYFRTRHTIWVVLLMLTAQAATLLFVRPAVLRLPEGSEGPLIAGFATVLQIVPVAILTLGLTGRTEQFEFQSPRRLWVWRMVNAGLLFGCGTGVCAVGCVVARVWVLGADVPPSGAFASLRAFIGLAGIALGAVAVLDMRLGALVALPFILLPLFVTVRLPAPLPDVLCFALPRTDSVASWVIATALAVGGFAAYVLFYSERNSPSTARRAILEAKRRKR